MRKVILLDERTRRVRTYEMKQNTSVAWLLGPRRWQGNISTSVRGKQGMEAPPKPTSRAQFLGGVLEDAGSGGDKKPGVPVLKTGGMDAAEYAEYKRELDAVRHLNQVWLPPDEYAMFMSEVNTHLSDEDRKHALVRKAIGNNYYTFVNWGFDNYTIVDVEPID